MFGLGRKRVELDEFCLGNIVVIIITCSGVILNADWSIMVLDMQPFTLQRFNIECLNLISHAIIDITYMLVSC